MESPGHTWQDVIFAQYTTVRQRALGGDVGAAGSMAKRLQPFG